MSKLVSKMFVYKSVYGIDTRLITFGDPFKRNAKEVIVVITGSPGIPEFYIEFAEELHRSTQLPVCIVGHAGHDCIEHLEEERDHEPSKFNLESQIEHKLEIINKNIDKNSKLHIVGHSIGAWMLVELLYKNDYLIERICSVNLLFPTLQKFSETPNGKYINCGKRFFGLLLLLFFITQCVPEFVRLFFIKIYLAIVSWPSNYIKRILLYLKPKIQKRSMALAFESLHRINELNINSINKVKHLTNVVYSVYDGWVPMHHIEDLKMFEPYLHVIEVNVDHAFVLKYSLLVANKVAWLIQNKRNLN